MSTSRPVTQVLDQGEPYKVVVFKNADPDYLIPHVDVARCRFAAGSKLEWRNRVTDRTNSGSGKERATPRADPAAMRLFELCCACLRERDARAAELLPQLEAHLDHAAGWQLLAVTLLDCHQVDAAQIAAQRSIAADPTNVGAHAALAVARMRLDRGAEAVAGLEQAERIVCDQAALPYQRGMLLRQLGDHAGACIALERATSIEPGLARAWFALGLTREDMGDYAAAAAAYRTALQCQPDLHQAALNLGIVLQELRDLDAALDAYAACYRMHPPSFGRIAQAMVAAPVGRLWLDLAQLRAVLGDRA